MTEVEKIFETQQMIKIKRDNRLINNDINKKNQQPL